MHLWEKRKWKNFRSSWRSRAPADGRPLGVRRWGHLGAGQEIAEERQRLARRVHRHLVPGAADGHERQALVHDRPSANLSFGQERRQLVAQQRAASAILNKHIIGWLGYLQVVVPRRPLLDGLEPELVEGEPRRRHGDPPVCVAAEDPDPEAAGDELADDGEGGEGGVVPSGDHVAAQHIRSLSVSALRTEEMWQQLLLPSCGQ